MLMSEHDADAVVERFRQHIREATNSEPAVRGPVILPPWLYDAAVQAGYITPDSTEWLRRQDIPTTRTSGKT